MHSGLNYKLCTGFLQLQRHFIYVKSNFIFPASIILRININLLSHSGYLGEIVSETMKV